MGRLIIILLLVIIALLVILVFKKPNGKMSKKEKRFTFNSDIEAVAKKLKREE